MFRDNDPLMVLTEIVEPIVKTDKTAGAKKLINISVPSVSDQVRSISIVAGIRPKGSANFIADSNVITYSR